MASASIGPPKTESVPPDSLTHRHLGIPRFKPAGICSKSDIRHFRDVPCVDGSGLARRFFTSQGLVDAAMCSA
jgi:hypothetical protein